MKIIVTENYDASCAYAADMICRLINRKPNCKLGLATGSTPIPVYRKLIEANKAGKVSFRRVRTVNLDEYCGIPETHDQSYRYFMDTNFFNHIDIDKSNTFVPRGTGDYEANAAELEMKVYEGGAADLQLLGIGDNGHIAFNEAGSGLHAFAHIERLSESTVSANARFFASRKDVPAAAITMGIGNILAAECVLLIAAGSSKTDAVRGLISDDIVTAHNPSSMLKLHGNAIVVVDKALANAAGYTDEGFRRNGFRCEKSPKV